MFVSRSIHANHADLIRDVAYDFYGRRMATCSSDQTIKIWDLNDDDEWICTASWRCHLGSAWRVTWAHPEFGQVIATCSFDRTIAIWEEIATSGQSSIGLRTMDPVTGTKEQSQSSSNLMNSNVTTNPNSTNTTTTGGTIPSKVNTVTNTTNTNQSSGNSWVKRADLVDSRTSVTGLQFAPRHLGLQLAAISTDGMLRIYEAVDVMNLSQWRLQFDFGTKLVGSCLAWSQSRLDPPLIAVGSASPTNPNSDDNPDNPANSTNVNTISSMNHSSVNGKLVLYEYSDARRHWDLVEDVRGLDNAIYDLQFAPHMGQSFHTLAVGSNEVFILRIRLTTPTLTTPNNDDTPGALATSGLKNESLNSAVLTSNRTNKPSSSRSLYEIRLMAHFDHHKGRVWRVSWNVTGSLLASSGDDGCVRLWQANYMGIWSPIAVISPDGCQSDNFIVDQSTQKSTNNATRSTLLKNSSSSAMGMLTLNTQTKWGAEVSDVEPQTAARKTSATVPSTTFQKCNPFSSGNPPVWH